MTDTATAETLTARQREILAFVRASTFDRGYPPSMREIGDAVGLRSSNSVHYQLRALERKGYLRRNPTCPRAITLTDPTPHTLRREAEGRVAELETQLDRHQEALEFIAQPRESSAHSVRRCWEIWPEDRYRWCHPCVAQAALDPWIDQEATA